MHTSTEKQPDITGELASLEDWDETARAPREEPTEEEKQRAQNFGGVTSQAKVAKYEEDCKACRGTGAFRSYTGRIVGKCFKCNGKGKRYFRTSPEARQKARQDAKKKKDAAVMAKAQAGLDWMEQNPERAAWLKEETDFDFRVKMVVALRRYGKLTENQISAIDKCIASGKKAKQKQADADDAGFSLSGIPSGRYLIDADGQQLKIKLDNVQKGRWAGWVFVKTEDGDRLGAQKPGHAYNGKHVQELLKLSDNPLEHAKEYGKATGTCGVCNRTLTNPESIELGIGPICRGKFA